MGSKDKPWKVVKGSESGHCCFEWSVYYDGDPYDKEDQDILSKRNKTEHICELWSGEAVAHKISAAPDMLREMKSLAKALEDVHDLPQSFYDAIKKAEGR